MPDNRSAEEAVPCHPCSLNVHEECWGGSCSCADLRDRYSPANLDKQRLKEAVWRVQSLVRQGRLANFRLRIIDSELTLLADALGVEALT